MCRICAKCNHNIDGTCAVVMMPVENAMLQLQYNDCPSFNEKNIVPRIIGVCGYARAGKDTFAKAFIENAPYYNFVRMAFADELKIEVGMMLNVVADDEQVIDLFDDATKVQHRDLLVFWGKYRREKYDSYYWIRKLESSMPQDSHVVITDVRYPNEAEWIRDRGGSIFYIDRPGFGPANDEEAGTIQAIKDKGLIDLIISNDDDVSELKHQAACIARSFV